MNTTSNRTRFAAATAAVVITFTLLQAVVTLSGRPAAEHQARADQAAAVTHVASR